MKVALVYDRVNTWGGAERVLLALNKIFPDAPLYTSVYNGKKAGWALQFEVKPSFLQKFSLAQNNHEFFAMLMPLVFESLDLSSYDVVISITSEAAKGVITRPDQQHICIILTPTRYLWSGYRDYFSSALFRFFAQPLIWYLRTWDLMAANRVDTYISISSTVKERVLRYYHRESQIVYPPLTVPSRINTSLDKKLQASKPYFLFVSRLSRFVPYKKVELVLEAAKKAEVSLVVVGEGRDKEYYQHMAGSTAQFVGKLTDQDLFAYYKNAQALIFPAVEDFGLVMVEAQSMGTPVIAYKDGGAAEIVIEDRTGVFFETQTVESLASVLKNFEKSRYNTKNCIENAKRFSVEEFEKRIKDAVYNVKD